MMLNNHSRSVDSQKNRRNYLITRSILKFRTPRTLLHPSCDRHYQCIRAAEWTESEWTESEWTGTGKSLQRCHKVII